ncbi:hypothetical protein CBS101457_003032 [Exobasidium rhododendri]|nr:hypothetical protein CBS101457_003032 [Exobasidium rhododendri]
MPPPAPKSLLGRHRQLAPTASVKVSPLCLGTMTFGDAHQERYGVCSKEDSFKMLDHFYEQGGNFLDTANAYRDEQSEQWVGEWMAARGNRDDLIVATKYASNYKAYEGATKQIVNYGGNGVKSMKISLEASLKKLQTSYIDLFYLHWWDYATSIPEIMQGLNDLVRAGKVLYLGISDAPAWVVSKANQYARDHGLSQFVVYQGMYNLSFRDFERDILPMCQDEGMGLAPYGTLNQGRFQTQAEFKRREEDPDHGGRNFIPTTELDKKTSLLLEKMGEKKGVSLLSIALAYVLQKAPYFFPIVGGRKVEHLSGNIEALGVTLTEEEIKEVESVYPFDFGFPHTFLSGSMFDGGESRGASTPAEVMHANMTSTIDYVLPPQPIKVAK